MKSADVSMSSASVFVSTLSQWPSHYKLYSGMSSGCIINDVSPSWTNGSYMLDTVLNSRKSKPGSDESDRIAERDVVKSAAEICDATRFLNSSFVYKSD